MEAVLTDFSPPALIDAIERSSSASAIAYVKTVEGEVHVEPELTWIACDRPLDYFNGVFRTDITVSDPDVLIETTLAYFRARQQSMCWWVTPATRPLDMAQRLEAHGLTRRFSDVGMAIDLHQMNETQPLPAGLTIKRVSDAAGIPDWLRAFNLGFGLSAPVAASYAELVQSVPPAQHPLNPFYLASPTSPRSQLCQRRGVRASALR